MRGRLAVAVVALFVLAPALPAGAAEWGLIRPGVTTTEAVRAKYGAPTRVDRQKVDSYDTESWIYEGPKAPAGIEKMTVEFGMLLADKYRPEIVRALRLEPKPGTFNRGVVTNGWGYPDRMGREDQNDLFLYRDGLLVYFEPSGWNAQLMIFTVPQPRDPTEEPQQR
jgi:hypothetical protein